MYLAFAKSAFQTQLAYRSQVWTYLFFALIMVVAKVAIWTSVYAGQQSVGGVTLKEMITYAILATTILGAWEYSPLIRSIDRALKTGEIATYLLKPISYPGYLFATESGTFVYGVLSAVLPASLIAFLLYGMLPPASPLNGAMFLAYWLLSFVIIFLIAVLMGLCAFWLMTAFTLDWLLQGVLSIFAGTWVPFWFFPEPLGTIARHLPFAWIGYYPTAVYLGKIPLDECWLYLGLGLLWAVALWAGVLLLWRRASLRLVVQGG
jgi:ABC-2 type transport system permease protein